METVKKTQKLQKVQKRRVVSQVQKMRHNSQKQETHVPKADRLGGSRQYLSDSRNLDHFYSGERGTQRVFSERVALRYQLYKGLMSELPFKNMGTYHVLLSLFSDVIWKQSPAGSEGSTGALRSLRSLGALGAVGTVAQGATSMEAPSPYLASSSSESHAEQIDSDEIGIDEGANENGLKHKGLSARKSSTKGSSPNGSGNNRLGGAISAKTIIERFFEHYLHDLDEMEHIETLFKFIQFIERQITLFDALEEASFEELIDIDGEGSLKNLLHRVCGEGKLDELETLLRTYKIRIVLTAHPTQFYPAPVLMIIYELYLAIKNNDLVAIQKLMMQLGRTPFRNKERPKPEDEAESILVYLKKVFYKVIPAIEETLEYRLRKELRHDFELPVMIEMGFWPGGDRDGNPYVTAQTTHHIAQMLKLSLLGCYIEDIKSIRRHLTFKNVYEMLFKVEKRLIATYRLASTTNTAGTTSTTDTASTDASAAESSTGQSNTEASNTEQPSRNESTIDPSTTDEPNAGQSQAEPLAYRNVNDFLAEVLVVEKEIIEGHNGLFVEQTATLIRKIKIFGFHFATLDIRQNNAVHRLCVSELLRLYVDKGSHYEQLSPGRQLTYLVAALDKLPSSKNGVVMSAFSERLRQLCYSLQSIQVIQAKNGEKGLHRYIISNTEAAVDVIEMFFLFQAIGVKSKALRVDIIPLFETISVLKRVHAIMKALYQVPLYREHLRRRGNRQIVMLGYSDGTKDGGYLSANWSIFRAKELISEVSREYGIKVIFFDGRGGPPARGGGESNLFYRALSDKMETHEIQLTVQGQTISSNFTTRARGRYNLEQIFTAGIENRLFLREEATIAATDRKLLVKMGDIAWAKYEDFKSHPKFIPYLEQITPLRFFGRSNVGSRPTKRSDKEGVNLTNLRAIPFVASWNQLKQNIPAYYGFGTALKYMIEEKGQLNKLQKLYQRSIFFRALIGNTMQALLKTDFSLTQHIKQDKDFSGIWTIAFREAELTKRLLLAVTGHRELLQDLPFNRLSILFRERIARPLLVIQQYALIRLREEETSLSPETKQRLQKMVIRSLAGSINASRNSA